MAAVVRSNTSCIASSLKREDNGVHDQAMLDIKQEQGKFASFKIIQLVSFFDVMQKQESFSQVLGSPWKISVN
jgi:hypothetical protein